MQIQQRKHRLTKGGFISLLECHGRKALYDSGIRSKPDNVEKGEIPPSPKHHPHPLLTD